MIWNLMQVISSINLLVGAFLPFQLSAQFSVGNCAIALAVGLALGVANLLSLHWLAEFVDGRLKGYPERVQERRLRFLYGSTGLWIFLSVFVSCSLVERLLA